MEIADQSFISKASLDYEVMKCIHIGLLCVQEYAVDRPTMFEVVSMLDNNDSMLTHPKQPAFLFRKTKCDDSNQSISERVSSIYEMSTTVVEAR